MAFFPLKSPLSTEERNERRRLILSDTLSLTILFVVTVLLGLATNRFYQSYASHQAKLMQRWRSRGEAALSENNPEAAIGELRSALAYSPGNRAIEIELATALASAGQTEEATAYFKTLLESEPGNGMINLQLARLSARQKNLQLALDFYHRAIYGNWEGDGYVRRREVRMELIDYLISHSAYDEARNELLVAAGNSPADDVPFQLRVAQEMERVQDPIDALRQYRKALFHEPASVEAMIGLGRTAFELGRYAEAREFLERAVNQPGMHHQPPAVIKQTQDMLHQANRIILLYPSPQLSAAARSQRILEDRKIALARLNACVAKQANAGSNLQEANSQPTTAKPSGENPSGASPSGPSSAGENPAGSHALSLPAPIQGSLENLASRFQLHDPKPAGAAIPATPPPMPSLDDIKSRWDQQPATLTLSRLKNDPDLAQATIDLIYDTERVTARLCGAPTGDDALLLKLAQSLNTVEQE